MKAGVMNTKRSRAPPEYAKSDLESTEGVFRYPERFDSGLEAKAFAFFCVDPSIINPPPVRTEFFCSLTMAGAGV